MSALVLAPTTTAAEEAFARVRGTTDRPRPAARLVPALPPAPVEDATGPAHTVPLTASARVAVLRVSDRSPMVDVDDDEPGPLPGGDPAVVARTIALAALEVLAGRRSPAQLARWLTPGVYDSLQVRAGLTQRVLGEGGVARPPVIRRARACRVGTHVLEASVVADDGARVRAVAVRLEGHRGSWRVTALEIG
ncbi:Rv3235 family protein [Cellulomonas sp. ICMP 17802]|uniref:Rv3235 family protein n=1 Tax=Cellulomonas sp. ICMP 17802 TaxID=3239199 RepID=UPI00351BDEFF